MATVFELGLLNYFSPIIVFLFVLIILWALLEKTNFFPGNKFANMLIAFCLSFLFILIPELREIITLSTPWFVIMFIFLFMLILIFLFMGVKPEVIGKLFGGPKPNLTIVWFIIIIAFAIFGYAFTQVYGEQVHAITSGETTDGGSELTQNIGAILFTPKVLGMVFLMVLAGFAVRFISTASDFS